MPRAHVVSHTHWDRAWYLPFQRFRVHFVQLVDGLLELLEGDPRFRSFTLDGQTALLDDYLAIRPENRARLARLVAAGRLEIGPWFVLPDAFLPSGEALIRNLQRGLRAARALGAAPQDGYMPDSFGHIEQMPQLLRGFGLRSFLFMRGLGAEDWQRLGCEFTWRAPDGSEVLAVYLREGYLDSSALGLPATFGDFEGLAPDVGLAVERIETSLATRAERTPSGELLLLNGCDHMPVQPELPDLLEALRARLPDLELRHGTLRGYVDAVLAADAPRAVHEGDLLGNAHHPVLSNVWSARIDLKQHNWRAQWWLEQIAEPLCAAAGARGLELAALLDEAWRLLLLNHPHDDICGCSVDAVHEDDRVRFREVEEIASEVASECVRELARGERLARDGATQWLCVLEPNLQGEARSVEAEVFFPQVEDEAPPGSFALFDPDGRAMPVQVLAREERAFRALRCDTGFGTRFRVAFEVPASAGVAWSLWRVEPRAEAVTAAAGGSSSVLENRAWRIEVHAGGRIDLEHRPTGTRIGDALAFESSTDQGDEYTYGVADGEVPLTTRGLEPEAVERTAGGPVFGELEVRWALRRARGLADPSEVALPVALRLRLPAGDGDPELRAVVDNTAEDHRLRLLVATDGRARAVHAGAAFSITRREAVPDDALEPERGYPGERVYATQCFRDFVHAGGETGDLLVAARGLHEYELLAADRARTEVALTLVRAVGVLSRESRWRRVQAGPSLPTPAAQCPGRHELALRLSVAPPGSEPARLAARALSFTRPPLAMQARLVPHGRSAAPAPGARPLLRVDDPDVSLSALRALGTGLSVRVWNRAAAPRAARIELGSALLAGRRIALATVADLDDTPAAQLEVAGDAVTVQLCARQIQTVLFTLAPP